MKLFLSVFACLALLAGLCFAGPLDGKWISERKIDRNGEEMTIKQTFDLKTDGAKLSGTLTMVFGSMEPPPAEIKDGKIDGNKFSFKTVMSTPNGDFTTIYEGTIDGDTLKGTAAREGGEGRPFEAKRK